MPKPLRLEKDGSLAELEASVEKTITGFLSAEGWIVIPTKAEARMPVGAPAHSKGMLDMVAVRVYGARKFWQVNAQVLFIEAKRKYARTEKKHLADQLATAAWLRAKGFPVIQIPEGWARPFEYFKERYEEHFK